MTVNPTASDRDASAGGFRALVYACIVVSGCVALVFQVAWQKYLSFLVGSEARSISIVVSIFLLGLAVGYRFWGGVTERGHSRRVTLKTVGYIELAIAAYGILFPYLFHVVRGLSYASPDWLVMDMVIASVLLLLPTFLMGASIPMLTAAVPAHMGEVNYCHSRVYGLNTLGAFAGAFLGGFYLVPTFGLPGALALAAFANFVVALVFITNRLPGAAHEAEEVPMIPNRFGTVGIYLFVFTTGAVTIGYEVIFMRILGLSAGSGHYIFPIVVGIVILGLAIGSLSIRRDGVTAQRVFVELSVIAGLLAVIYLTVPYWGYWISHIRVSLTSIESNHAVFMGLLSLFITVMLLPVAIPMGRLLPMGYALIDKNRSDYGKVCGRVYFVNTVGTVFGAVGIGYAMFRFLDLEAIFKLNIALILVVLAFLLVRSGYRNASLLAVGLAAGVVLLPSWDRELHYLGVFRAPAVQDFHFRGAFNLPPVVGTEDRLLLADDPNTTVAVFSGSLSRPGEDEPLPTLTISVNGKSDGNTIGDYSNMTLTGTLPYLYARNDGPLHAAVVGLGTGITSGVLAGGRDVAEVVTVEISSGVIDVLPFFDEHNFGLSTSPKSTIVQTDAFRYLSRTDRRFDIIASEPSNPWVVGVENLFTPEYYELAGSRLAEGGVFFQWVQLYEMNDQVFAGIIENVLQEFPYVTLYLIGPADVGLVASYRPLDAPGLERRFQEPFIREALAPMHLEDPGLLHVLELLQADHLKTVPTESPRPQHRLRHPWLGYEAGKARFLGQEVIPTQVISPHVARHHQVRPNRMREFREWAEGPSLGEWIHRCAPERSGHSADFLCARAQALRGLYGRLLEPPSPGALSGRLAAYRDLRNQGYLEADIGVLEEGVELLLEDGAELSGTERAEVARELVGEFAAEWLWDRAFDLARAFWEFGTLTEPAFEAVRQDVTQARLYVELWRIVRRQREEFLAPVPQAADRAAGRDCTGGVQRFPGSALSAVLGVVRSQRRDPDHARDRVSDHERAGIGAQEPHCRKHTAVQSRKVGEGPIRCTPVTCDRRTPLAQPVATRGTASILPGCCR